MATAAQKQPMEWTDFETTREFLALTDKQRVWVKTLIETKDPERSTATAYESANSSYSKMLTHQIENNSRVIAALNRFHGLSDRDAFIKKVERTIEQTDGWAKVRALTLLANLKFGPENSKPNSEDADVPEFPKSPEAATEIRGMNIGDIVLVDGLKHRVTAVDANGRPTEGDPL